MPEDNTTTTPSTSSSDFAAPVLPTVASDSTSPSQTDATSEPIATNAPVDSATLNIPAIPVDQPSEPVASSTQAPMSSVVVDPTKPPEDSSSDATASAAPSIYAEVANKIRESKNVLIALSSDPSVDEMAAAIGLSIYLDRLDKRATAIYSGSTPNALEFLKPEETFEPSADTLQDFVIALNKEKADHLRYKLDGDYVKIYITPYKTRLSEENLEFSYGDYNVDLVLALDVANGVDLDSALREHGRIMHDAVIVNVTTGNPGKFGEIEWSEKTASSISEMIAKLILNEGSSAKLGKEEATAFLTGIVAATNRFSNASTTPDTMKIASALMEKGANQQLISKNITPDIENELLSLSGTDNLSKQSEKNSDPTKLDIEHHTAETGDDSAESSEPSDSDDKADESQEISAPIAEKESTLLEDLKVAEASLSNAGAETTSEPTKAPLKIDNLEESISSSGEAELNPESTRNSEPSPGSTSAPEPEPTPEPTPEPESTLESTSEPAPEPEPTPASEPEPEPAIIPNPTPEPIAAPPESSEQNTSATDSKPTSDSSSSDSNGLHQAEKIIQPPADFEAEPTDGENNNKYGQMLEEAISGLNAPASTPTAIVSNPEPNNNPAAMGAPSVPTNPDINGVPEINYAPVPSGDILPPPPTPPIDMTQGIALPQIDPSSPAVPQAPVAPVTPEPQPSVPPAATNTDPSAFKIPGM